MDSDERELEEVLEELAGDLERSVLELELVTAGLSGTQGRLTDAQIDALVMQIAQLAEAGAMFLRRAHR